MSAQTLAPAVVGLSLALTGCGAEQTEVETDAAAPTSVAESARRTIDEGSARISVVYEHTSDDLESGIEAGERGSEFEGVVDFEDQRVALESEEMEVVVDGSATYLRLPNRADRRWLKYDLDGGPDVAVAILLFGRGDASRVIEALAALGSLPYPYAADGEETVRGETTTHYRGAIDGDELAEALVPGVPYVRLLESQVGRPGHSSKSTLSLVEGWVGSDGLLHRFAYTLDALSGLGGGERTIIELYDFGAAVDVEPPPADQTVEAKSG